MQQGDRLDIVIGELKRAHKVNQVDLAKALGISSAAISKMKLNQTVTSDMISLLETYKVRKEYLLEGKGPIFTPEPGDMSTDERLKRLESGQRQIINMLKQLLNK